MEQTSLCPVIGIHLQRIVVLPGDMQVRRLTHDAGCAVRFALIAFGLVLCRVPLHGCLCAIRFVWNVSFKSRVRADADGANVGWNRFAWKFYRASRAATEVAFGRREHANVPIFGDHRCPISGQINRGNTFSLSGDLVALSVPGRWKAPGTGQSLMQIACGK